ncbi:hypothetical protein LJK87_28240 [Paenibacillus sp. P25]|nr:hypothetical protein LJK87_28240 [Paenibacillus sp. P25]
MAEFSEEDHPAHRAAVEYKHALRSRLAQLCKEAGAPDGELAEQLMLVVNGALVSVPLFGAEGPAEQTEKNIVPPHRPIPGKGYGLNFI